MSSILEFRKRSLKLRSRLKKSLQKNATNEFIQQLECEPVNLPFGSLKYIRIIRNFLTTKDCTSFINFLHKNGAKQKPERKSRETKDVSPSTVSTTSMMRPRGLTWTINKNEMISNLIYERCFNFLPKIWIDRSDNTIWEISGINDDIKSLKYGPGDVLCAHYDTPYFKNKNERSFITTVLYLNDDFIGGSLQFLNPNNQNVIYPINIKSGTCLLFQHNTFHSGSPIQQGTKYMIRFEVLYRKIFQIKPQNIQYTQRKSCIWL